MIPLKDNIPTARFPIVTVLLILANVAVFVWQATLPSDRQDERSLAEAGVAESDQATIEWGAIPYRVTHPGSECGVTQRDIVCGTQGTAAVPDREAGRPIPANLDEPPWWQTVFSSMFMHAGLLHIGFNMLFLWIFGNNVEDRMGRLRYLLFYLLAGIVAVYAQALLDSGSTTPTIGASGAVAGVLGAYALMFPRARVLSLVIIIFFVTLIEVPAMLLLAIWFVLQFIPALGQVGASEIGQGGGVAYMAHVGGFIFGLLIAGVFVRGAAAARREAARPG